MFKYLKSKDVYVCPTDKIALKRPGQWSTRRDFSYAITGPGADAHIIISQHNSSCIKFSSWVDPSKSFTFMEEALDAPLNDGHIWPNQWDKLATRHRGSGDGYGINGKGNPREWSGLGNILMGDARVEGWSKQKFKMYGDQKGNSRLWKPYGNVTQPSPP
jgi:hypothetical protein